MKSEVYIQFKCGRIEKKANAKYKRGRKNSKGKRIKSAYTCKKHKNCFGKFKIKYCIDCGKEIIAPVKTTKLPDRCDPHIIINKANKGNKNNKAYVEKKKERLAKMPKKVFSVEDARNKGVNCIPLDRLFRVFRRIRVNSR